MKNNYVKAILAGIFMLASASTWAQTPANDVCSAAISLTVGATCNPTSGTLANAKQENPADSCAGLQKSPIANDVWYKFTASQANQTINVTSKNVAAVIILYSSCGGAAITCANPTAIGGTTSLKANGLTTNTTYFIRVYNFPANGTKDSAFTICAYNTPLPPPNDECAGAINMTQATSKSACTANTIVNTNGATKSANPISCSNASIDDDVWYKFTANSANVTVMASNKSTSIANTPIGFTMYAGSCTGTQSTECSAGAPGDTLIFRNLTVGTTYYIRTFTNGTAATGTYNLCVYTYTPPPPPANDECVGAINITQVGSKSVCTANTIVNTNGATKSANPINCTTTATDDDVWYKFTANSANVTVMASNKSTSIANTPIGFTMYAGSCTGTQSTECSAGASGDTLTFRNLAIGTIYYIRTFTNGTAATGTYNLCVYTYTPPPPPANDVCANAQLVTARTDTTCAPTIGTLVGALQESAADSCSGTKKSPTAFDVWYKFNATATKHIIDVTSANSGLVAVLYSACNGSAIACANPRTIFNFVLPGKTEITAAGLTIGNTYFVRVYADVPQPPTNANGTFIICVHGLPLPPANDLCAGAITLTSEKTDTCTTPVAGNFKGANQESAADSCTGAANSPTAFDVWYKFTAQANAHDVEVTTAGFTAPGMVVNVYDSNNGKCGGAIACKNPLVFGGNAFGGKTRVKVPGLLLGQTYFIRVYPYGKTMPTSTNFTICLYRDSAASKFVDVNEVKGVSNSLNVYPNPTKDQLHVTFITGSSANVKLVNVNGQVIYVDNYGTFNGRYDKTIDMTDIANGIYMLQITTDKETITRKVVKD